MEDARGVSQKAAFRITLHSPVHFFSFCTHTQCVHIYIYIIRSSYIFVAKGLGSSWIWRKRFFVVCSYSLYPNIIHYLYRSARTHEFIIIYNIIIYYIVYSYFYLRQVIFSKQNIYILQKLISTSIK